MKGQFFVITAVVMISFLVLIYSTVNFQSTGAAYIYSTNDHFVLNNILSEYSFMLRLDWQANLPSFHTYLTQELPGYAYNTTYNISRTDLSGNTTNGITCTLNCDGEGRQQDAQSLDSRAYIFNNATAAKTIGIRWEMYDSAGLQVSNYTNTTSAVVPAGAVQTFIRPQFNATPLEAGYPYMQVTVVSVNSTEKMRFCDYIQLKPGVTQKVINGLNVSLTLTSEDASISGAVGYFTTNCDEECKKGAGKSCPWL